ncbi:hypothetical protein [Burkholderia cepacia]|uniref:hypothetical protein n=1 Tax=Burkholderia cepacia TaxID=292 RepID=UPI002AB69D9C|nr:hypothetical protein [Burkholderia cepacia]
MAYTLKIQSPVFDNRDCIRGTVTRSLPEFGSFETVAFAFKKADMIHDEWHLDLGDGDNVQVWQDDQRVVRPICLVDLYGYPESGF